MCVEPGETGEAAMKVLDKLIALIFSFLSCENGVHTTLHGDYEGQSLACSE